MIPTVRPTVMRYTCRGQDDDSTRFYYSHLVHYLSEICCIFNTSFSNWNSNSSNFSQSTATIQAQGFRDNRPDFFDKGRIQMEQEVKQLEQENPQPILTIESGQIQWQNIIFQEGGFSIWMPAGTMTEETEIIEIEKGKIKFKVFASHPGAARFVVAYSEILNSQQLANQKNILPTFQKQIVDVTGFELSSDRDYNLGEIPGREFVLKNDTEIITFRIYLVGQRLHLIGASEIEKDNEITGAVVTFLDSFKVNQGVGSRE
ncbi:MAG: hypothetical protein F6K40_12075 [Okeania sp. SIO3I5]|uniref:hypothetical protein n=1 Tax=Okeania sp. SIO3I5 TaxID=2607805 RepID=UPI0013B9C123|nr:hypothetical protein [Okeania sp. SIO3I5]NEQ36968.1 hypothetical protein [Okeania sp. SIO3I5]